MKEGMRISQKRQTFLPTSACAATKLGTWSPPGLPVPRTLRLKVGGVVGLLADPVMEMIIQALVLQAQVVTQVETVLL
jgi:hypothetical protein